LNYLRASPFHYDRRSEGQGQMGTRPGQGHEGDGAPEGGQGNEKVVKTGCLEEKKEKKEDRKFL
jgi:hypothetical protein